MRVLTITNMWPDEAEPWKGIFVARQMRSLSSLDVDVDVIAIRGGSSPLRSLIAYARAAIRILALNLAPRRYDLIHAHTGHCGLLACLQIRYPVVLSYVGYDLDITADRPDNARTIFERNLFRQLSRVLAATIAKSRRGRQHLPEATQSRNTVVPNGVDRSLFAPMARTDARERIGLRGDERPIALFPADPDRYNKRFELAQAAVDRARREFPELRLEVVCGQPGEQVALWMSAADVMVMSSRAEGSPNVVKEAMSCDLPVVGVDVGDVREVIEGSRHCHVCEPEPEAMGRAIIEVLSATHKRSDGRDRSEHLGLQPIAHRVLDVYRQAIARGPGPFGFVRRRKPKRCVA